MLNKVVRLAKCASKESCAGAVHKSRSLNAWEAKATERFRRCRNVLGWSQERTGIYLGVSSNTVRAWESREADKHARVPAAVLLEIQELASVHGADSDGRLPIKKAVGE